MTDRANPKLQLKKATGWFPAGYGFLKAMTILSDGPFKVFVYLCLKADRQTATCQSSYQRLAAGVGKSRHTVEAYVAELKAKGLCTVVTSRIPYVGSTIRIADEYWPFVTVGNDPAPDGSESYVGSVRRLFMALGCTSGRFGQTEERGRASSPCACPVPGPSRRSRTCARGPAWRTGPNREPPTSWST